MQRLPQHSNTTVITEETTKTIVAVVLLPLFMNASNASAQSAQQHWARAVWNTLDNTRSAVVLVENIETAIAKSAPEDKVRILLCYSDILGLAIVPQAIDAAVKDFENRVNHGGGNSTPESQGAEQEAAKDGQATEVDLYEIVDAQLEATFDTANRNRQRALLRALAIAPNCVAAWMRLVTVSEGDILQNAYQQLFRLTPNNALPHYMHAAWEMKQNNIPGAIKDIERGNRATTAQWYPTPLTTDFSIKYPEDEILRKLGITDEPVSPEFIAYSFANWQSLSQSKDPYCGLDLRQIKSLLSNSKSDIPPEKLIASLELMSMKILFAEPAAPPFVGLATRAFLTIQRLDRPNPSDEELKIITAKKKLCLEFMNEFGVIMKQRMLTTTEDRVDLLRGRIDPIRRQQEALTRLRTNMMSGLLR